LAGWCICTHGPLLSFAPASPSALSACAPTTGPGEAKQGSPTTMVVGRSRMPGNSRPRDRGHTPEVVLEHPAACTGTLRRRCWHGEEGRHDGCASRICGEELRRRLDSASGGGSMLMGLVGLSTDFFLLFLIYFQRWALNCRLTQALFWRTPCPNPKIKVDPPNQTHTISDGVAR
jgi:hypothetical protein